MRFRLVLSFLFSIFLLGAGSASATTVLKLSIPEMVKGSHTIVLARVLAAQPVSIDSSGKNIQTHVRLELESVLKGNQKLKQLTLKLAGGRLGKWAMHIPGMPTFKSGEQVLLFLEKTSDNWALTGLSQGKFSIYVDANKQKLVRRNMGDMHFVGFDKSGRFHPASHPVDKATWRLAELLEQIKGLVAAQSNTK